MLAQLLDKFRDWTPEKSQKFHNASDLATNHMWETTSNGIFLYRERGVHFFTSDGIIHKINDRFTKLDFDCHCTLYKISKEHNQFRVDIPLYSEYITDNGKELHYCIVQRPNKQYGTPMLSSMFTGSLTGDDILAHINDTRIILASVKSMNTLAPNIGFDLNMRLKDDIGYFWSDFKIWDMPYNECVDKTLFYFSKNINFFSIIFNKPEFKNFIRIAEEQWKTI